MIVSIARQSVILKCLRKRSVMLGNYEFYYGAGFSSLCFGVSYDFTDKPKELNEQIKKNLEGIETNNPEEKYLIKMLLDFRPTDEYNDQMKELFEMGLNEHNPWQVNI